MLKEAIYIVFCGLSFAEKEEYQAHSVAYVTKEKHIPKEHILIVSDPQSTDLGKSIVSLKNKTKQIFNPTVSGMLDLAASCNLYWIIHNALTQKKHVFCNGSFTEILACQGRMLTGKEIGWDLLKNTYHKMLETMYNQELVRYPDVIFFCIPSFDKEHYTGSDRMREAYKIISQDHEFTKHTKVILIDQKNTAIVDIWNSKVKSELDKLLSSSVVIYTKSQCPYCVKAKLLLDKKKVHYQEIKVDDYNDEQIAILKNQCGGRTTVPQIFINKQHIGGCDALYTLEKKGKLDALLQ